MKNLFDVIKTIHLTEKATVLGENNNEYVFKVDSRATRPEIREAVKQLFGKTVLAVRTCNYAGKNRHRGNSKPGRDSHWKKAVVKLKAGERIDLV
ncbi:MAG: 50S ribosomal protein L23 [Verrucomicrobiaceae bacterium]|nr:50S ribosomal protein L23 [Verrucomicrobiaceae bacterium]